jgi:primosomal protein N'
MDPVDRSAGARVISRIVLAKFHDHYATDAGREEAAQHTREVFAALADVARIEVGVPSDAPSLESWDLCLQVQFESQERLDAYTVDPDHVRYVQTFLNPRAVVKKAWNFAT